MTKNSGWFEVDKAGLAKLLEKRGKAFAVMELIQNAWDTAAKQVDVKLELDNNIATLLVTDDDPEGFKDLTHAFTIFAESEKKGDALKRGRFNLGEKFVLALCTEASIKTTKGLISFGKEGRHESRSKTEVGSVFQAKLPMSTKEFDETVQVLKTLLPPKEVKTVINDVELLAREPLKTFEAYLMTEVAEADGILKRLNRKTTVSAYEPLPGEVPSLYELGIPVVGTDDKWHIDIGQKVPLNMDRDNVPPHFLKEVRTLVVNNLVDKLTEEDANQTWVREATSNPKCSDEAIARALGLRFGEKRVIYDPSDPEANSRAVSEGYTVISGRMLNSVEWSNVKRATAALPAGQVTPSPKPFGENGKPLKIVPQSEWTGDVRRVVNYIESISLSLLKCEIEVVVANDAHWPFGGTYGDGRMTLNVGRLGYDWFKQGNGAEINRLVIHELGHHYSKDHLSAEYHQALCRLGGQLVELALREPSKFTL